MANSQLTFIIGGGRSGKSEFAEQRAATMDGPVTYIATLSAADEEMRRRVTTHQKRRPAEWASLEEPCHLPEAIRDAGKKPGVLLIDCLTGWISNLLLDEHIPHSGASEQEKEDYILSRVHDLATAARQSNARILVVSNEVGMGLVPPYPVGRLFRDIAGKSNRYLASMADEVYFVVAGLAVEIKSLAVNLKSNCS